MAQFSGINVGVFYAISTLLSQMVLFYFPKAQEETGTIGLLIVVSGMFGSVVCGYILDKWHHFKSILASFIHWLPHFTFLPFQGHNFGRLLFLLHWNGPFHCIFALFSSVGHFHHFHCTWVSFSATLCYPKYAP
jgi:predicted MFS family arabinose efflux permease